MKIYLYCFYMFVRMWKNSLICDTKYSILTYDKSYSILASSMALVSLIQISNINTILILPVILMQKKISADFLVAIVFIIGIINIFVLNKERLYRKAESRWKDEPEKKRMLNRWMVIIFFVVSVIMMFISAKIVYIPHSMTFQYWGN